MITVYKYTILDTSTINEVTGKHQRDIKALTKKKQLKFKDHKELNEFRERLYNVYKISIDEHTKRRTKQVIFEYVED